MQKKKLLVGSGLITLTHACARTHTQSGQMGHSIDEYVSFTWRVDALSKRSNGSVNMRCACACVRLHGTVYFSCVWSGKATQGLIKRLNSNHEINCWVACYTFCLWSETDYCTIDRCWSEITPRRRRRQASRQITTHSKAQICCSSQLLGSLLHRLRIMAP